MLPMTEFARYRAFLFVALAVPFQTRACFTAEGGFLRDTSRSTLFTRVAGSIAFSPSGILGRDAISGARLGITVCPCYQIRALHAAGSLFNQDGAGAYLLASAASKRAVSPR